MIRWRTEGVMTGYRTLLGACFVAALAAAMCWTGCDDGDGPCVRDRAPICGEECPNTVCGCNSCPVGDTINVDGGMYACRTGDCYVPL